MAQVCPFRLVSTNPNVTANILALPTQVECLGNRCAIHAAGGCALKVLPDALNKIEHELRNLR